ncbi:hypothetical protein FQR65_LT09636 [Abscondita terminalis]|nr:hypothetical protein FQR65_LT09636 [Abscondita terminalis]
MSTQAYYKDRLGFDPKEALFDGQPHEKYRKLGDMKKEPHGYEENLTKFKGTTIWEYFVESTGTVDKNNVADIAPLGTCLRNQSLETFLHASGLETKEHSRFLLSFQYSSFFNEFLCKLGVFTTSEKNPNFHKNELKTTFFSSIRSSEKLEIV